MDITNDFLLFENVKVQNYRHRQLKIIMAGGFLFNLLYFINNFIYDNITQYFNDEDGYFIKNIFITETIINLSMWILSFVSFYYFQKKRYNIMRNLIFLTYGINLGYSIIFILIPWIFIGDNFSTRMSSFEKFLSIIFNIALTFILFIPNIKGASLRHYIYTGKYSFYTIALVSFIFELFLTIIALAVGIQGLSVYFVIKNDFGPVICFVIICLLYMSYNIYTIKNAEVNKDSYDFIIIILGITIIALGFYLMIFFDFGFNIINTIFIGNISSMAIFEFIGYIS